VEKRELLYPVGGNVNSCSHHGKEDEVTQKLKRELPYDPAIPLLSIYPKNIKTLIQKYLCTYTHTHTHIYVIDYIAQP